MNNLPEVSYYTRNLLQKYQDWYKFLQLTEGISTIHVDEVTSKVASFYEKMRGVIDWREEHLLRKTAIERIIKRRLFLKKEAKKVAPALVHELIRGGHFPNDIIPESKIAEVQKLLDKYIFILNNAPPPPHKRKLELYDWLLAIAACEVEEVLTPPLKEKALMEFMLELMKKRIEVQLADEEKNTQIYIAVQRALFKLDPPLITYHLLQKWYPQWSSLTQETLEEIAKNIYLIWGKLEKDLKHYLAEKFFKICERYDTAYLILGDIISQDPTDAKTLENPDLLENKIRSVYGQRLKKVKARMRRAALYSTLSIFLSKVLVAFALEVPFDQYVTGQFSYNTLWLSILIPTALMFFLVLTIRPPSKQNLELVVLEVMKIVYAKERKDVYMIKPSLKRGLILNTIITLFYLLSFLASFGLIVLWLQKLNFSIISIIIFIGFVSLISFAGVKIRQRAKELVVEKEKETFLYTIFDLFSLPFIRVGKWLSAQWVRYNIVMVLFNSLLDMPFQAFLEFLEQWRAFLKEKKEEIH